MSVKFENLERDSWDHLHDMTVTLYLDNQCYEFATALHRGLNWKLFGLIATVHTGTIIRHALVQSPGGKFWDARGEIDEQDILKPFRDISGEAVFKPVTLRALRKVRQVPEPAIKRASLFAEALWPDLPWGKQTFHQKANAFMKGLEALCHKHGVYIRGPHSTMQPVLGWAHGDEKGFKLTPTTGGQYSFDRVL